MKMFDVSIHLPPHHSYRGVMHMTSHCDNTIRKLWPIYIYISIHVPLFVFTLLMLTHSYFNLHCPAFKSQCSC